MHKYKFELHCFVGPLLLCLPCQPTPSSRTGRRGTPSPGKIERRGTPSPGKTGRRGTPSQGKIEMSGTPSSGKTERRGTPSPGSTGRRGTPSSGRTVRSDTPSPSNLSENICNFEALAYVCKTFLRIHVRRTEQKSEIPADVSMVQLWRRTGSFGR